MTKTPKKNKEKHPNGSIYYSVSQKRKTPQWVDRLSLPDMPMSRVSKTPELITRRPAGSCRPSLKALLFGYGSKPTFLGFYYHPTIVYFKGFGDVHRGLEGFCPTAISFTLNDRCFRWWLQGFRKPTGRWRV